MFRRGGGRGAGSSAPPFRWRTRFSRAPTFKCSVCRATWHHSKLRRGARGCFRHPWCTSVTPTGRGGCAHWACKSSPTQPPNLSRKSFPDSRDRMLGNETQDQKWPRFSESQIVICGYISHPEIRDRFWHWNRGLLLRL